MTWMSITTVVYYIMCNIVIHMYYHDFAHARYGKMYGAQMCETSPDLIVSQTLIPKS